MKRVLLISLFLSSVLWVKAEMKCTYHHNRQMTDDLEAWVIAPNRVEYHAEFKTNKTYQFWEYYNTEEGKSIAYVAETKDKENHWCQFVYISDWWALQYRSNEVD